MIFPFYIARRYLFAKKSHNVINIITLVSVTGVMVGTMALIIVLSVFNGFENLILSLYNTFNPDIEISLAEGKTFSLESFPAEELQNIEGVALYSEVLDETGLLTYRDSQHIVQMRGVSASYREMTRIDTLLVEGEYLLQQGGTEFFLLGMGVAHILGANINDYLNPLSLYIPRRGMVVSMHPSRAFNASTNFASGIFGIQSTFDLEYVLVPIDLARRLLEYQDEVSSIAVQLYPDAKTQVVQQEIEALLGPAYQVKNRYQQQAFFYKIMKSEKWIIFLILTFILLIAAFNVVGSLSMLIIEKRNDIHTLHSMGASKQLIRRIFLLEGILVSLGGALAGIVLGGLICWLQQRFGLIGIQAQGSYIVEAYPVAMKTADFILVTATVFCIGLLFSALPANKIQILPGKRDQD